MCALFGLPALAVCGVLSFAATTAFGATVGESTAAPGIDVVQVQGLLDPANASLLDRTVRDAEAAGSTLLVIQLDSGGALDIDVDALVETIASARVPVAVWVGPPGASAKGAATMLAAAADVLAVAPGSSLGPVTPVSLDAPGAWSSDRITTRLGELEHAAGRDASTAGRLLDAGLSGRAAVDAGAADLVAPTVGELIVGLDGRRVELASGGVVLSTAKTFGEGRHARRRPNQEVRFTKLDLGGQVSHTLATPWVAYLFFVAGAALVVFEFFSLGVGLAAGVGALAIAMSFAGLSHLPVRPWALGLIAVGVAGTSFDLQAGVLAFWTAAGSAALVAGSFTLYGGSSRLHPVWWVPVLVCASFVAMMLTGMKGMLRARFSNPAIGAETMVGEAGSAVADVEPEGVVSIRGAFWKARVRAGQKIRAGEGLRVVAAEGLLLEVEPEPRAAR